MRIRNLFFMLFFGIFFLSFLLRTLKSEKSNILIYTQSMRVIYIMNVGRERESIKILLSNATLQCCIKEFSFVVTQEFPFIFIYLFDSLCCPKKHILRLRVKCISLLCMTIEKEKDGKGCEKCGINSFVFRIISAFLFKMQVMKLSKICDEH
jgi:hypothetical protein